MQMPPECLIQLLGTLVVCGNCTSLKVPYLLMLGTDFNNHEY